VARDEDRHRHSGFTLIEVLVVLILLGLIALLGFPALQNAIARSRLEGTARQITILMQQSRFDAIKNSAPVSVRVDIPERLVTAFRESASSGTIGTRDSGEPAVGGEAGITLPRLVDFVAPGSETVIKGFSPPSPTTAAWVTFNTDGSVRQQGAFRIGDNRSNFLELAIEPAATARIEMRKWDGSAFVAQGSGSKPWAWN
jgi:prepilin-type N-terminal cleavage/methylation domain-containing protein